MGLDDLNNDTLKNTAPSFKFPTPGTTIKGWFLDGDRLPDTDLDGQPRLWADGTPRHVYVLTILTPDGDTVAVWARGRMWQAIREAVATGGGWANGGRITITYTGDGEPTKPGYAPPKLFTATWKPPADDWTPPPPPPPPATTNDDNWDEQPF